MNTDARRYDIDALRVAAVGLLIVYHVAVGFQSWGVMVGFIAHVPSAEALWTPMSALNIWRIPLLFFVSGMGVCFAMHHRTGFQLLMERSQRILLPFVFAILCIVPLHLWVLQAYYGWPLLYSPGLGHVWFLGNIFIYTIVLLGLFVFLKNNHESTPASYLRRVVASPLGWLIVMVVFAVEAVALNPYPYELYAMSWHGFTLGFMAFFVGYLFIYSGENFWIRIVKWRWWFLIIATILFTLRTINTESRPIPSLLSIESNAWVFCVLAFGHKYLNRPSQTLAYLSQAAYPIYIIHMLFLYLASALIFPMAINVYLKFVLIVGLTMGGCLLCYEYCIRRIFLCRFLFGVRPLGTNSA